MLKSFALLVALLLLSSCTSSSLHKEIQAWHDDIAEETFIAKNTATIDIPSQLTFAEAVELAIKHSGEVHDLYLQLEKDSVGKKQALSELWPRISLAGTYEMPIREKQDGQQYDNEFSGGLRFDYDIIKSIFRQELVKLSEIATLTTQERIRKEKAEIYQNLLQEMFNLDALERKIKVLKNLTTYINERLSEASKIAKIKGYPTAKNWHLESTHSRYKSQLQSLSSQLEIKRQVVKSMLGLNHLYHIQILDREQAFRNIVASPALNETLDQQINKALAERGDVRIGVYTLMASSLQKQKARREFWPKFKFRLGLGDYRLESSDDEVRAVGYLDMSLPLLDFGDRKRHLRLAEINESQAKYALLSIPNEVENAVTIARLRYTSARALYNDADIWNTKSQQRANTMQNLVMDKKMEKPKLLSILIENAEAELMYIDAELQYRTACIYLLASISHEIVL